MDALTITAITFGANLLFYALAARLLSSSNRLFLFLATGLISGGAMLIWSFTMSVAWIELIARALSYALLCEVFLSWLGMCLTSVSASLLVRLSDREMGEEEMGEIYSASSMVSLRLERMLSGGFLQQRADHYVLTGKGRRTVSTFRLFQRVLRHVDAD